MNDIWESIGSAVKGTSITEWLIFVTALLYVVLAAMEHVLCWLFGILSSALTVYLCYSGHLFLESGLNIFYVLIGIYGWYEWLYGSAEHTALPVVSYPLKKNGVLLLSGVAAWIPLGFIAHRYSTQVLPYIDAFITAFSLVATWMTAKKIIENWLYWIVIDALAVFLYAYRGFYLLSLLYVIYTILAAAGYLSWRKKLTISSASR